MRATVMVYHILSYSYVPGPVLITFYILIHLIVKKKEKMKFTYTYTYVYYCPYFTVDEPKDLSSLVNCLRSHSRQAMETEFESRQFSCRICTLHHSATLRTKSGVKWD